MTEKLGEKLCAILNKSQKEPVNGYCIKEWRVTAERTDMLKAGVKNNVMGSVYTPPSYKGLEKAEVYIIWEDERCSRVLVENESENSAYWDEQLNIWRIASFPEPYAAVALPGKIPEVTIDDEQVKEIIFNDSSPVFEALKEMKAKCPARTVLDAGITCAWSNTDIVTSTGINVINTESRYACSWAFDSVLSAGYYQRDLISASEKNELWQESLQLYRLMAKEGEPVGDQTSVVFSPALTAQMLGQYIVPNFKGENILEEQSKFSKDSFDQKAQIFHSHLTLKINPLHPYKWSSYRITGEGIPAMETVLIKDGVLESPYLNLKDSLRWLAEPTAMPAGAAGLTISHSIYVNWDEYLAKIKDGVLVHSVLGLHTQNSVAGHYSLSAPYSLRIKNGKITGKVDVKINGNWWDILNDERTIFAFSPLHDQPYLVTNSAVNEL